MTELRKPSPHLITILSVSQRPYLADVQADLGRSEGEREINSPTRYSAFHKSRKGFISYKKESKSLTCSLFLSLEDEKTIHARNFAFGENSLACRW